MSREIEHVALVGYTLPDPLFAELLKSDPGMPVQTQRFAWAVARALMSAGIRVTAISAQPVTDYPNNPRIRFHAEHFQSDGVRGMVIPFVNLTGLKHITRFVSACRALRSCLRQPHLDAVLVHGVNSALLSAALSIGCRTGTPVVVIVTDAPSIRTRFDNQITWQLKQLDRRLIRALLSRVAGVVVLTRQLAEDFAPGLPMLLLEGISSVSHGVGAPHLQHETLASDDAVPRQPIVVYAGGVNREYGVLDLVEAAERSHRQWSLVVYGRGPDVAAVQAVAARSPKVHYGGMVDAMELKSVYARADLLVNPRPPGEDFVKYSFPSKLLEYLATGTPVMTTRLPTLPLDYAAHLTITEEGSAGLMASIDAYFEIPRATRRAQGLSARQFILETRGTRAQGIRLRRFLTEIADDSSRRHGTR